MITRISDAKDNSKKQKLGTQINGKFNDISSADKNK
jgi:hypothetical protein